MLASQTGYGTGYKLCYSGDIQTLFGMLRKNGVSDKSPEVSTLLSTLGMSLKSWKAPTGFYYVLKYTKNVFQPMYSSQSVTVSQQLPVPPPCSESDTAATIQGRGLFRSVVLDRDGNILSYSPAKTLRCNDAADLNAVGSLSATDFIAAFSHVEEFVEGTMIHLFRSAGAGTGTGTASDALSVHGWEISTKGVVGGDVFVPAPAIVTVVPVAKTTFRDLFIDACIQNKIDLSQLDPQYSYSLVLQHHKNPMVAPVVEPRVVFIAAYTVDNASLTVTRHARSVIDWKGAGFQIPRDYATGAVEPFFSCVRAKYANPSGITPYRVMGVVFHGGNHTGWSFKLRNPAYETAKKTPMESNARLFYEYCSLRRSKEVKQHLALFPEDAAAFSDFNERILAFVKFAYDSYVECFILKKKALGDPMRTLLYRLHNEVYYPRKAAALAATSLTSATPPVPAKVKISFNDVLHYVNNAVAPADLFFSVNALQGATKL
jgi:hypothetical protein